MKDKSIRKVVSCGIIPVYMHENKERKFLLVLQNNGNWSFPKGHVDKDETFVETAKRELFEETGLVDVNIFSEKFFSHSYIGEYEQEIFDKTVHYFVAYAGTQKVTIQEEEIKDFCWCSATNILKKLKHKSAQNVFKEALVYLKKIENENSYFLEKKY